MKKAIIIGASSGIGRELAKVLSTRDYTIGLVARRLELLTDLQKELPVRTHIRRIDIAQTTEAMRLLSELIEEMEGADIIIICAAICIYNPDLNWQDEINTVNVDVVGVAAMVNVAFNYFSEKGSGHIVGISSFKALRGGGSSPAYNAAKAFLSNYLEGLRVNSSKLRKNIFITDIRPGLVDTSMTARRNSFFVAPVKIVASQICEAIENKETISYIPKRYNFIAYLMGNMPFCIYRRL